MAGTDQDDDTPKFGALNFYKKKVQPPGLQKGDLRTQRATTADLDPDVARCLFEEGAFLIFLDVPEKTEFGIDCYSWNVGEKFKGIKMIPPGVHFLYYSAVSKDNVTSPRTGFFHNFRRKEVLVKRWDPRNEGLCVDHVAADDVERYESNLKNLDPFLGAYPYENYKKWVSISRWITEKTVQRLSPVGPNGSIFSVQQLQSLPHVSTKNRDSIEQTSPKKLKLFDEIPALPEMHVIESTRIRFSEIPTRSFPPGATPSDVTRMNFDKSSLLETFLSKGLLDDAELLGEIQFAFVCFLVGQVFDAFEQWKRLVVLICGCERLAEERAQFFLDFISLLYFQLQEVPKDFFVDIVSRENFLTSTLQTLFAIIANTERNDSLGHELRQKAHKFRLHLQKLFRWDFSSEGYEDAPVVVQI